MRGHGFAINNNNYNNNKMEIGNVTLKAKGINVLTSAIHPKHGLVWTDGKCIFLARFKIIKNQVEHGKSVRLKEFDSVRCVQWSQTSGICYLSIAHKDCVTIWKVDGEVPRLEFKQIRKVSIQILPQGCQWNPCREVLCLLSKQQVRFFYRHGKTRGCSAIPALESGKITCGSWSKDGLKLVVCVGSALLIYSWKSIDSHIAEFETNAWNVPKMNSDITAIASMTANLFALASEVPASSFCLPNSLFELSDSPSSKLGSSDSNGNENQVIDIPEMTNTQKLMNLKRNPEFSENNLSQLVIVHVKDDMKNPEYVTNICVKEIISPDILHYEAARNVLVIGGNTHPRLQLFALTSDKELLKLANVEVESHSRPKGVCSIPECLLSRANDHSMLIMLGKQIDKNNAFPSASLESKYELWLQCFSLDHTEAANDSRQTYVSPRATKNGSSSSASDSSRTISECSSASSHFSSSPPQSPIQNRGNTSLLPAQRTTLSKPLIEEVGDKSDDPKELTTETVDFNNSEPKFSNPHVASHWNLDDRRKSDPDSVQRKVSEEIAAAASAQETSFSVVTSASLEPEPTFQMNGILTEKEQEEKEEDKADIFTGYEHLENELHYQNNQIAELEKKIDELVRVIDTSSCVFPTIYQSYKQPETINVIHVLESGISIKKTFLLDHGRLKMDAIKLAFCLNTVELYIDGLPIILSANIDGYIPLKFEPKSTLFIGGVSSPSSDDTISISSLASSSQQAQSPLNDKKPATDLTVTGAATAVSNGTATRC